MFLMGREHLDSAWLCIYYRAGKAEETSWDIRSLKAGLVKWKAMERHGTWDGMPLKAVKRALKRGGFVLRFGGCWGLVAEERDAQRNE